MIQKVPAEFWREWRGHGDLDGPRKLPYIYRRLSDGELEAALLSVVFAAFQAGARLSAVDVQTLRDRGMIDAAELERWQQDPRRHLTAKQS